MSNQKIKLKYLMGLWKVIPGYPTLEDFKYEIESFIAKEGKTTKEFSSQNLSALYGSNWINLPHGKLIEFMIESGEILETKRSTSSKKWYILQ